MMDGKGYRISVVHGISVAAYCGVNGLHLGAIHKMRDGSEPEFGLYIVHKKDTEIIENWDPIGLRGTGSNAVKVDNVYVPADKVFPITRVVEWGHCTRWQL